MDDDDDDDGLVVGKNEKLLDIELQTSIFFNSKFLFNLFKVMVIK